jgi:hypothetical protein
MIVRSAAEIGCAVLYSEHLNAGRSAKKLLNLMLLEELRSIV